LGTASKPTDLGLKIIYFYLKSNYFTFILGVKGIARSRHKVGIVENIFLYVFQRLWRLCWSILKPAHILIFRNHSWRKEGIGQNTRGM
jgi:hypothetical protein